MTLETIISKQKVCITLDTNSNSNVVPLFSYIPYSKLGYRLIDEYIEIKNMRAISWIYNLTKIEFPVFELEDTESKQLLASINLEWKSPRIQLDIVLDIGNTLNWQRISAYSLLNPDPYPYREFDLGNHSLGNNSMLGLQVRNVGYGLLQNSTTGNDKVTVFADLERFALMERSTDTGTKIANNITNITSTIVNSNPSRQGLTLFNNSEINVYIDIANTVSTSSYLVKLVPGAYWEAPSPIYTGAYWAKVESGNCAIDIREFS